MFRFESVLTTFPSVLRSSPATQPYRGALRPLGIPRANRLLKDNFELDADLLLYCLLMYEPSM
jgi:hypothetical protein